jgi:predicted transcriptional regulator of viral defense system
MRDEVAYINDGLVFEAIYDGYSTIKDILNSSYIGLSESCVEKSIRRLVKNGRILRINRGEFRICDDFDKV